MVLWVDLYRGLTRKTLIGIDDHVILIPILHRYHKAIKLWMQLFFDSIINCNTSFFQYVCCFLDHCILIMTRDRMNMMIYDVSFCGDNTPLIIC